MLSSILLTVLSIALTAQAEDWKLIWSDEFDGPGIDFNNWEHEITAGGGGNSEFQVYVPDETNSYVQDGKLFLRVTKLADNINPLTGQPFGEDFIYNGVLNLEELYGVCTNGEFFGCYREGGDIPPVASARVRTAGKFSYRYGRAVISAKMPVGDWLWPAMWLLPEDWVYGGWPMSGEIDMTESIGNRDFVCDGKYAGVQKMGATLHWGIWWDENRWWLTHGTMNNDTNNYGDSFHEYRLDWTPQGLEFFIDDNRIVNMPDPLIHNRDSSNCFAGFYDLGKPWSNRENPWDEQKTCDHLMAPFDQDYHFILNVAVGGQWYIPDGCVNQQGDPIHEKPWPNGIDQRTGMHMFYDARAGWEQTWLAEGDNNAMQVDYVRVFQPLEDYPRTRVPEGCPEPPPPYQC